MLPRRTPRRNSRELPERPQGNARGLTLSNGKKKIKGNGYTERNKLAPQKNNSHSSNSSHTASGSSSHSGPNWGTGRIWAVGSVLGFLWLILWGRLFLIQIINGPEYAEKARRQDLISEVVKGRRGTIYDRNGKVLARSIESISIAARPGEIQDIAGTSKLLSEILNLPERPIRLQLQERKNFVWLARKIDDDRAAKKIREAKIPGIYIDTEYARVYPHKDSAGQLIGFVGTDNKGLEGLEAAFQSRLSGAEVRNMVQRDARGRRIYIEGQDEMDNVAGQDLHLTLDLQIQFFAEEALANTIGAWGGRWGGCIVVDVQSGDILAWAQYPFFNPNVYQSFPRFVMRDKLAMDALEQGSTIKPFLVASALQEKKVTPDTEINCENGTWTVAKKPIRDTSSHGMLKVHEIIKVSSNIGCAKIGIKLGAPTYWDYLQRLGFGRKSGLPLMGESTGILRAPENWHELDLANSSFGQSFSATGAQMAQAYLSIASGGMRRPLHLVTDKDANPVLDTTTASMLADAEEAAKTGDASEAAVNNSVASAISAANPAAILAPKTNYRVFSDDVSRQVLSMMKEVVQDDGGTGAGARIPGVSIGGKTGTAQKADNRGSYGVKRVASFVGVIPAESPRYLIYVIVDEPVQSQYGGIVATPIFRDVAARTLAYEGQLETPQDPLLAAAAAAGKFRVDAEVRQEVKRKQDERARAAAREKKELREFELTRSSTPAVAVDVRQAVSDTVAEIPPSLKVPDVRGLSARSAMERFAQAGVVPLLHGSGSIVERQSPPPGGRWPKDMEKIECILWLKEKNQ